MFSHTPKTQVKTRLQLAGAEIDADLHDRLEPL